MKVAILADLHLPDQSDTVKDIVLNWAINEINQQAPDVIIAIGDMTSIGTPTAACRFREKLESTGIPYLITPGNAEYRSPTEKTHTLEILHTRSIFRDHDNNTVAVLNNSSMSLTDQDEKMLRHLITSNARGVMLAAHFPLSDMTPRDQNFIYELMETGIVSAFVSGHTHEDKLIHKGNTAQHWVRGLDPDKATGGAPAISFFVGDTDSEWTRMDTVWKYENPDNWTKEQREEFCDLLGFATMDNTQEGLDVATKHAVKSVELRSQHLLCLESKSIFDAVSRWREVGGRHLSIHFPDLIWDKITNTIRGITDMKIITEMALQLNANRITIHVPRCSLEVFKSFCPQLASEYCKLLHPL